MVRPSAELVKAAQGWVPVRVTNMSGVDISTWRFDFDLTFSVVLANADGTTYHRFGTRGPDDASSWSSIPALIKLLPQALQTHTKAMTGEVLTRRIPPRRTIEDSPSWKKRTRGKKPQCVHCHNVGEAEREDRSGKTLESDLWVWPTPTRIGLALDRIDQTLVSAVTASSPAGKAGLKRGDQIQELATGNLSLKRCLTIADLQHELEQIPSKGGLLKLRILRDGKSMTLPMLLEAGWRTAPVREVAWRATKWKMLLAPGFGGPALNDKQKKNLGLAKDNFAFRIQYMVTWGENRRFGQAAGRAGLRTGDVVASVSGKSDFDSIEHFHAWYRTAHKAGDVVDIVIYRKNRKRTLQLKVAK